MRYTAHVLILILLLLMTCITPALSGEKQNDNFNAIDLYNKAVDQASAGNFQEAVNLTDKALIIQPNFTLALVTRAGAYLSLGEIKKAEESLQKAIALDPGNPSVLASAASISLHLGKNREAVAYTEQAIHIDPTLVEAWIMKGTAHGNLGEYAEELNASEQALLISPGNTPALTNRDYAKKMLEQTHKTPLGLPELFFALFCVIFLKRCLT